MPDLKAAATRKIGPLPVWGWAVAIGGGILIWRAVRRRGGGGGSPFAGTGTEAGSGAAAGLPSFLPSPTSPAPIGFDPASGSPTFSVNEPFRVVQSPLSGGSVLIGSPSIGPISSGAITPSPISQASAATKPMTSVSRLRGPTANRVLSSGLMPVGPELTYINRAQGIARTTLQTAAVPVTKAATAIRRSPLRDTAKRATATVRKPTIKPVPVPTTRTPGLIAR